MDRRWGEDGKDWLGTSRSRISRPCCVSSSPNTTSQSWSGRYRIFSHWFLRTQQVNGKGNFLEAMISLFCKWFGFLMYLLPLFSEYVIAFPYMQDIGAHSAFFSCSCHCLFSWISHRREYTDIFLYFYIWPWFCNLAENSVHYAWCVCLSESSPSTVADIYCPHFSLTNWLTDWRNN